MAKLLFSGGAGFIGSHVVELFHTRGFEAVIPDDLLTEHTSHIKPQLKFYQKEQAA